MHLRSVGRFSSGATVLGTFAVLGSSCASLTAPTIDNLGPVPPGAFTTDATGYVAHRLPGDLPRYHFRIVSRFENRGGSTLYLARCYPDSRGPLFSVMRAGAAESGYAQVWACVGHDRQFAVRTREVRVDTLLVVGPNAFQGGANEGIGALEGDFRLYYEVRLAAGERASAAPDSLTSSNAFRVRTSDSAAP